MLLGLFELVVLLLRRAVTPEDILGLSQARHLGHPSENCLICGLGIADSCRGRDSWSEVIHLFTSSRPSQMMRGEWAFSTLWLLLQVNFRIAKGATKTNAACTPSPCTCLLYTSDAAD